MDMVIGAIPYYAIIFVNPIDNLASIPIRLPYPIQYNTK